LASRAKPTSFMSPDPGVSYRAEGENQVPDSTGGWHDVARGFDEIRSIKNGRRRLSLARRKERMSHGTLRSEGGSGLFSCANGAILSLHWWTFHRTVGAKDAAVAWLGAQHRLAADTFVENLASVGWHRLALSEAADRAHQHRFQKNADHINANQLKSHRNAARKTSFPLFSTTAPGPTMI
jgi:hypothetical protein